MSRIGYRRLVAVALVAGIGLTGAACSSSKKNDPGSKTGGASAGTPLDPKTKVTISADCEPPTTEKAQRSEWIADVAAFHKIYPNVTVKSKDAFPCEVPATFTAHLQGGKEADTFYTYYTDLQQVLDSGQAADISDYVNAKTVPNLASIDPSVLNVLKDGGKLYGLPTANYKMGLIYNRKIFQEAGLDPNSPPTTWAAVQQDAKIISDKLKSKGISGYMDNSAGNQGGWHLVSEMNGMGVRAVSADGTKATFNAAGTKSVLQTLHDMRWNDKSMPSTPGLVWGDVQKAMGTGKIGIYVGAPDDVTTIVQQYHASYNDLGMGPIPGEKIALMGGNDYMFKKSDTPDQIKAGIAWINFEFLTLNKGQFQYPRKKADGLPVGLPEPFFFTGAAQDKDNQTKAASATIPVDNFKAYTAVNVPVLAEPPNAQKIYTVLDTVMSGVLTNKNANIDKLLNTATNQVNQLLAASS
jgi:ABC-type glycerol-3-phosphate transport system substrate-binding protein